MQENKDVKSLPFFGIPKMVPYLKDYRGMMLIMVTTGLFGSAVKGAPGESESENPDRSSVLPLGL